MKKKVGICVPCFNEEENVVAMAESLIDLFEKQLPQYSYHIMFIDNHSTDNTRPLIRELCKKYPQVRAIFNAHNYPTTSGSYGIMNCLGDCVIAIPCDFQVPLDLIPTMLEKWENGAKIVALIKTSSEEKGTMWALRQLYYGIQKKFSNTEVLTNFTGTGLYDNSFVELARGVRDPIDSWGNLVASYGSCIEKLEFRQPQRRAGRSKSNLWHLIDTAVLRFTSTSTIGPRLATIFGFFLSIISVVCGVIYLILKLCFWDMFPAGTAPILIGVFFLGAVQLFFIGLIGEYVVQANTRLMRRPLVAEDERLNFPPDSKTWEELKR